MTRKDYIRLADAFARSRPDEDIPPASPVWLQWRADVHRVADALAGDNGRFDRDRFARACGIR